MPVFSQCLLLSQEADPLFRFLRGNSEATSLNRVGVRLRKRRAD
jgi:hypothetical protein